MPGSAWVWNSGQIYFKPYAIQQGKTIQVITELDWNRPYIEKNFAVQVWGEKAKVTLKEKNGKVSKSWYLYNPVP